jgi:hypothetical protein
MSSSTFVYTKLGVSATASCTAGAVDVVNVQQEIKSGNLSTAYQNGTAGAAVDVSACVASAMGGNFYIGGVGGSYTTGSIAYVRLDAETLSVAQLKQDRELIMGTAAFGLAGHVPSTITRATTKRVVSSYGHTDT